MPELGTTAVLALLPDAEPLLRLASDVDPGAVRAGVPAHAALLYPWVAAADAPAQLDRLRAAIGGGPLRIRLGGVERTGGFVGIPVPELRPLATAVRTAFPASVPYGGRFGDDPPVHVTVALDTDPATAARIAALTTDRLPIDAELTALHVVALTPDGWTTLAELPL